MKKILVLGSTGSIGVNTLEIARSFPDKFKIVGLTSNNNISLLEEQINEFHPETVVVVNKEKAAELKRKTAGKCEVLSGEDGLLEITRNGDYDILVSALVGFAGLSPTIEAIKQKKRIALANKETLVTAGEIIIQLCEEYGAELIPVDSEHSAIFQSLIGETKETINKLILTASGGPFLHKDQHELEHVTIADALKHPNWKMGNKITIDSATMMNKGLEIIEAFWLFGLPKEKIEVVIHPQSIIHSMVEFIDGSIKAQMSSPDMKLPILYALTFPERYKYASVQTNFAQINKLTFFPPDFNKFTCLKIAYDAIQEGGTAPCILNAANEVAVDKFLSGKIRFTQIPDLVIDALEKVARSDKANLPARSDEAGARRAGQAGLDLIFESDLKTREYLTKKYS